ncbi:MAG: methyltransferase domain-containing protein [Anaerolineae bacterium]|nr:methyltransferase domain-containing protein [Anaerolineae bacterium]
MDTNQFRQLLTKEGQWALESAVAFEPREQDFLGDFKMLAKRFERELARAALTTAILRREAAVKFPQADKMYFTREALQQASSWEVASYRAKRYAGFERVLDLGCSIGSDSLALAGAAPTLGIDIDPLRVAMAQANAQALNLPAEFIQADLNQLPVSGAPAAFFDPARRDEQGRVFSVRDYNPPLEIIRGWQARFPALGVKISPGVKLNEIGDYDCEVEFISLKGELKEAMLWFGPLKGEQRFRATVLPGEHTLTASMDQPTLMLSEPRAYIYEPDPAILRAGLVGALGAQLHAAQLDPTIGYLTADTRIESPFARVWEVEDWLPFQLKRLRAAMRERNVGRLTVKKRGSPLVPEELIQDLRLEGEEEKVLFLTQQMGKPIVVIAKPNPVTPR